MPVSNSSISHGTLYDSGQKPEFHAGERWRCGGHELVQYAIAGYETYQLWVTPSGPRAWLFISAVLWVPDNEAPDLTTLAPMHPIHVVMPVTNIQVAWLLKIPLSSVARDSNFYQLLVSGEISLPPQKKP